MSAWSLSPGPGREEGNVLFPLAPAPREGAFGRSGVAPATCSSQAAASQSFGSASSGASASAPNTGDRRRIERRTLLEKPTDAHMLAGLERNDHDQATKHHPC